MKLFSLVLISTFLITLVGCATVKVPSAMGGSKADGSITMGYGVSQFEKPVVNWENTKLEAARKCQAWGYKDAEAFGGQKSTCNARNGYGTCVEAFISMEYQCLGEQNATK